MFVYVKDLCEIIDKEVQFVKEAKANKENHESQVYEDYMKMMQDSLTSRLKKLDKISCNDNLKAKYNKAVKELF